MKKFSSIILAVILCVSTQLSVFAATPETKAIMHEKGVTFCNVGELDVGKSFSVEIVDCDGNPAQVGIELVSISSRASVTTWRVWFVGVILNAEFYMDISNNKVISVRDYQITTIAATYENPILTHTTTYGRLSFDVTGFDIISKTCWLKGTVTGSNDDIDVTWSM